MTATAPAVPDGEGGAPASPAAAPAPDSADFLQRAAREPQWAAEQITKFQSRADSAEAKNEKLVKQNEPVQALIEEFGAATVQSVFENYRTVRGSEAFGEGIQEFEKTGKLPARKGSAPKVEDDDEYKTPEEQEMESLRAEVADLRRDTSANTLASGKEVLTKHMEQVFRELNFAPEDVETARNSMVSQIKAWEATGEAGLNAMKSLGTPNGYKTVRGILLADMPPEAFERAVANTALRKQQGLSSLATDGPSGALSTGKEAPPEFADAMQAAAYAAANPDGHDSY